MSKVYTQDRPGGGPKDLDALLDEILVDAYDEYEQMTAFQCALSELDWPVPAKLGDMELVVHGVDWEGQSFSSLEAQVVRDGHRFDVSFHKLVFEEDSPQAQHLAAFRRWLGVEE